MGIKAETLPVMYKEAAEVYQGLPAFATKTSDGTWQATTFDELYELGACLATALIERGVKYKNHVGLLADNRLEWIIVDYAVQLAGAVDVPRGTDITDSEIEYILNHAGCKVVFAENKTVLDKLKKNKRKLKTVKTTICMDPNEKLPRGVLGLYNLIEEGRQKRAKGNKKVEKQIEKVKPDDLYTLIYTSGTTGPPKGVMLTHSNMISQIRRLPVEVNTKDRALSILPVWHIFERAFEMLTIHQGTCTYYTNVRRIGEDMREVKPTFIASAPRLWESVYTRIVDTMKKKGGLAYGLFKAAFFFSRHFKRAYFFLKGLAPDFRGRNAFTSVALGCFNTLRLILTYLPYKAFDAIVLKKLRAATGGALRGSVSGGGALPLHVDEFFNFIGVPVLEGYGMTETSPVIATRNFEKLVIGTVGPMFPDTELNIVDPETSEVLYPNPRKRNDGKGIKGEIHVRGPQVMLGYYKNKEATRKVLQDGWMNTGDLGMLTFNDCLKILGRSKDTIVLASGENVEPVPIENQLTESPYIDQCMLVGQDQKYLAALIVPSLEGCKEQGIEASSLAELTQNAELKKALKQELRHRISGDTGFKAFERVHDFRLVEKPFEIGDELTNLQKVKRHIVTEKYAHLIDDIYKD